MSPPTRRIPAEGGPGPESMSQTTTGTSLPAASDGNHNPEPLQGELLSVPRARNHIDPKGQLHRDPETSMAAARSVNPENVTRIQRAILNALTVARRPMSDEDLCESLKWLRAAESGIRSRRSELLKAGLIEVADEAGTTKHGRRSRRYRVRAQRGVA